MFQGNECLRGVDEKYNMTSKRKKEWIKCAEDPLYFIENYFHIITLDDGKQLFKPYEYQKKTLKCFVDPPNDKSHVICMFPRQSGKTTIAGAYLLHYILFNENKTVAIMANKQDTAIEIMTRVKLAYESLPLWLQQGVTPGGWNRKSIELENGSKIFASSTSSSSISGKSIGLLYIDEFSKIPEHVAEAFITATYPVISSGKTAKIIITSTPVGMNHFHEFWTGAVKKRNNFYPIKVPWWHHPNRDKAWKEKVIRDIGKLRFQQEYGLRFLGSTATLVDADVLEMMETKEPVDDKWTGALRIYENPLPNTYYIMGVDTAKGMGYDRSVVQVLKHNDKYNLEQVATYQNDRISSYDYAQVVISISEFYNNAMMMIESNGAGEGLLNTVWYEYEYEYICNVERKGLGVYANRKNKLEGNLLLKEYIEKDRLKLNDKNTVTELTKYVEVKPNVFKGETRKTHDDHVTALLWALYFLKTSYYDDDQIEAKTLGAEYKLKKEEEEPIMMFDEGADNNNVTMFDEDVEVIGTFTI